MNDTRPIRLSAIDLDGTLCTSSGRVSGRTCEARLRVQALGSEVVLAGRIHRAVQFMAYPSGAPFRSGTLAAQARIRAILARYGYIGAVLDPVTPSTRQDARALRVAPRARRSHDDVGSVRRGAALIATIYFEVHPSSAILLD